MPRGLQVDILVCLSWVPGGLIMNARESQIFSFVYPKVLTGIMWHFSTRKPSPAIRSNGQERPFFHTYLDLNQRLTTYSPFLMLKMFLVDVSCRRPQVEVQWSLSEFQLINNNRSDESLGHVRGALQVPWVTLFTEGHGLLQSTQKLDTPAGPLAITLEKYYWKSCLDSVYDQAKSLARKFNNVWETISGPAHWTKHPRRRGFASWENYQIAIADSIDCYPPSPKKMT